MLAVVGFVLFWFYAFGTFPRIGQIHTNESIDSIVCDTSWMNDFFTKYALHKSTCSRRTTGKFEEKKIREIKSNIFEKIDKKCSSKLGKESVKSNVPKSQLTQQASCLAPHTIRPIHKYCKQPLGVTKAGHIFSIDMVVLGVQDLRAWSCPGNGDKLHNQDEYMLDKFYKEFGWVL